MDRLSNKNPHVIVIGPILNQFVRLYKITIWELIACQNKIKDKINPNKIELKIIKPEPKPPSKKPNKRLNNPLKNGKKIIKK